MRKMKFDFIIGNPPYQEETTADKPYSAPLYDKFLDGAYQISDRVEMIHPARFLFNAGGTSKEWNQKMLDDEHLKVLWYESESEKVFSNTDIKGGIAVTYHDRHQNFGPIGTFTAFPELNSLKDKVWGSSSESLMKIVTNRGQYKFSDLAYKEQPEEMKKMADRRIAPSVFDRMPAMFTVKKPDNGYEYIQIYGNCQGTRTYRWFRKDYLKDVDALYKYKVMIPKANGTGAFGESIPDPLIGNPMIGHTETYISIGAVNTREEAEAILKYIKSKFCRALLGILKITQNNSRPVWQYVPLQDFTPASDINWTKSIPEIDQQLYAKYGLDDDEIGFIETHVKEMK